MPRRPLAAQPGTAAERLAAGVRRLREEQRLPDGFDLDVRRRAKEAAASPRMPDRDRTDIPFFTLDPEDTRDLDQAMHLERDGEGYLVRYAIADVSAFVSPGDPVHEEAWRRGTTCYGATEKIPLHPPVISEDAGSLLPDRDRPAVLWTMRLDAWGHQIAVHVERAVIRSRRALSYPEAEDLLDAEDHGLPCAPDDEILRPCLDLLREIGRMRLAHEAERRAISLPIPSQEVEVQDDGTWSLRVRPARPVEQWNAQISLLTGMSAAQIMIEGGIGVLRTLPPPVPPDVDRLRRTALGLGLDWPADIDYPAFIRTLDPEDPASNAVVIAGTRLLRGAAYAAFDGELPELTVHAAIAAPYAHATAPLRRLADRYVLETCLAIRAEAPVPDWVRDGLPELPAAMAAAGRRAAAFENAVIDLAECLVLAGREGEVFTGVVVERDDDAPHCGRVQVPDPAIEATIECPPGAELPLGRRIDVRLVEVDETLRRVRFERA
ncbi:RNB domain-containing ribonuclease [Nocardioidaceae bacterium]|nr:RNB domain-containing ribonuclease [Nocardioidaceae bacterium]